MVATEFTSVCLSASMKSEYYVNDTVAGYRFVLLSDGTRRFLLFDNTMKEIVFIAYIQMQPRRPDIDSDSDIDIDISQD